MIPAAYVAHGRLPAAPRATRSPATSCRRRPRHGSAGPPPPSAPTTPIEAEPRCGSGATSSGRATSASTTTSSTSAATASSRSRIFAAMERVDRPPPAAVHALPGADHRGRWRRRYDESWTADVELDDEWTSLMPMQPEGTRPPFFYVSPFLITILSFSHLARCMQPDQPFFLLPAAGDGGRPPGPRPGRGHGRALHLRDAAGAGVRVPTASAATAPAAGSRSRWPASSSVEGDEVALLLAVDSEPPGVAPPAVAAPPRRRAAALLLARRRAARSRCAGSCACAASATSAVGSVAGETAAPGRAPPCPRRGPPSLPRRRHLRRRPRAGPQRGLGRTPRQGLAPAVAGPHHGRADRRHGRRQPRRSGRATPPRRRWPTRSGPRSIARVVLARGCSPSLSLACRRLTG